MARLAGDVGAYLLVDARQIVDAVTGARCDKRSMRLHGRNGARDRAQGAAPADDYYIILGVGGGLVVLCWSACCLYFFLDLGATAVGHPLLSLPA